MFKTIAMKRVALALLVASTVVGAAEAQLPPAGTRLTGYCTGPLFTLSGGTAKFYVALDDNSSEPSVLVRMRFIDQNGTVVKARTANIGPSGSATLEYRGSGLYRVQAETFESLINLNFSDRRTVVGSVELFDVETALPADAGSIDHGAGPGYALIRAGLARNRSPARMVRAVLPTILPAYCKLINVGRQ